MDGKVQAKVGLLMSGVAYHNNNEFSTGSFAGATGSAGIETVNSFSTDSSSTNTVGSSTIQDLLKAGTDVYLGRTKILQFLMQSTSQAIQEEIYLC